MSQSTSKFKQGEYIQLNGRDIAKILAEVNGVFLLSCSWVSKERRKEYEALADEWKTEFELNANGYHPVTPQEAGVPKEKWVPGDEEEYFRAYVDEDLEPRARSYFNYSSEATKIHLESGNVHKDSESAIAWAKKRYNIS